MPGSIGLGLIAGRRGFTSHKPVTLSICLSLSKVEASRHSRHAPTLSDAVVQSNTTRIQGSQSGEFVCGNWGLFIKWTRRKRSGTWDGVDLENCAYLGQTSRSAINYRVMRFRGRLEYATSEKLSTVLICSHCLPLLLPGKQRTYTFPTTLNKAMQG